MRQFEKNIFHNWLERVYWGLSINFIKFRLRQFVYFLWMHTWLWSWLISFIYVLQRPMRNGVEILSYLWCLTSSHTC